MLLASSVSFTWGCQRCLYYPLTKLLNVSQFIRNRKILFLLLLRCICFLCAVAGRESWAEQRCEARLVCPIAGCPCRQGEREYLSLLTPGKVQQLVAMRRPSHCCCCREQKWSGLFSTDQAFGAWFPAVLCWEHLLLQQPGSSWEMLLFTSVKNSAWFFFPIWVTVSSFCLENSKGFLLEHKCGFA